MRITLDNRERDLYDKIKQIVDEKPEKISTITCSQLTLGDILIRTDNLEDLTLIERKSLKDLLASIKDGRYEEQSYRLIHSSGFLPHNIVYIIEGPMNSLRNLAERNLVYSCITSLNYFKGFSVLRTSSLQETAELIIQMTNKIHRNFAKGIKPLISNTPTNTNTNTNTNTSENENENENENKDTLEETAEISQRNHTQEPCDYSHVVKKVKKDNITKDNIGQILLCQIPGISSKSALAIMAKFGTFSNLLKCLENDPNCMSDVMYESADGKSRKISKVCSENIINLFLL